MMTRIFLDCWKHHMININLLQFDQNDRRVYVYTYFPYTPNHCEHIESTFLLSMGNHSISIKNEFFPNKLRNFYKCPLHLATYTIPPYMILHKSNDGTYKTNGIEGNLYREMAASLNFRPMVRVGTKTYLSGAAENFHMLKMGKVNFTMFAAVNTAERSTEFTSSFPYAYSSVVYTIPPGPPYTPLEKLILPFEKYVWLWILICTGLAFATISFVSGCCSNKWRNFVFGAKNCTPFLNYINIMLGGAIGGEPVRNFARTIFVIWLFGSLVLRSSYTGAMFSFIQSQKSAIEIQNLEQLVQYNFSIYSSMQMLRLVEFGYPHLSNKYSQFVFHIYGQMIFLSI